MPFTYKIDTSLGLVFYSGFDVSVAEMFQAEKAASNDPLRQSNMKIIIDLSRAELDISLGDISSLITLNSKRMEKGSSLESTAIISNSRFAKVLGDTLRLLGEGMPLHFGIFYILPDAINWLGLSGKEEKIFEIQKGIWSDLQKDVGIAPENGK